jgi:formylglycine-generating enzyme required for sulfatase activity
MERTMRYGIIRVLGALAVAAFSVVMSPHPSCAQGPPAGDGGRIPAGTVWREPLTGIEFVYVPGGVFEQGCGDWISGCSSDAKPPRKVTLREFWIGKYEVTQTQWKVFMGVNPLQPRPGERYPVERVSWLEAAEFVRKMSAEVGHGSFALPTEAQWEYACRAGGKRRAYGTESGGLDRRSANYGTDQCCGRDASDGYSEATRVGSYAPNGLGLYDMTGNLWEWVRDTYDEQAYVKSPVTDPVQESGTTIRVTRGGSYMTSPGISRCTDRKGLDPATREFDLGVRLVWTKTEPAKAAPRGSASKAARSVPVQAPKPAGIPR